MNSYDFKVGSPPVRVGINIRAHSRAEAIEKANALLLRQGCPVFSDGGIRLYLSPELVITEDDIVNEVLLRVNNF